MKLAYVQLQYIFHDDAIMYYCYYTVSIIRSEKIT